MTNDDFWRIIDRVHAANSDDMDAKCDGLRKELMKLNEHDLKSFINHFDEADARAYDWKLWGAAYVIGGGCSDDAFSDFRATLISMGRKSFERVLADPDSLAITNYDEEVAFYEGFQYVANTVAEERFGKILSRSSPFPSKPSGTEWTEDDLSGLERLLPNLSKKYR